MTQIPAGWYPDPAPPQPGQPPQQRFWNGAVWTEHVAPLLPTAPLVQTPAFVTPAPAKPLPTTPDGVPLAGWWWRVLAQVIDGFILGVVSNLLTLPVQIRVQGELQDLIDEFTRELDRNPDQTPDFGGFLNDYADVLRDNAFWLTVPTLLIVLAYLAFFLRWKGATPGKLAVGLRVRLRDRPGTLPWGAIAARLAVQAVIPGAVLGLALLGGSIALFAAGYAVFAFIFLADVLWPLWDPKRQALHDKLARTNVVKVR